MRAGLSTAHSRESGNPSPGFPPARGQADDVLTLAGVTLAADPAGAMYWPEESLLVVADLHLEKGSAFAARGVLLPPYDTATTLGRLGRIIERYAPRLVVALGDSFHDGGGPARMADVNRTALTALQRGRDWLWIAGNHDPDPAENIGGRFAASLVLGALTFRHEPAAKQNKGEIAGHLHPQARVSRRGRVGEPALLCQQRQSPGDAGIRRLCRRTQCARPRDPVAVRHAVIHRAYARRRPALRRPGRAMPGRLVQFS